MKFPKFVCPLETFQYHILMLWKLQLPGIWRHRTAFSTRSVNYLYPWRRTTCRRWRTSATVRTIRVNAIDICQSYGHARPPRSNSPYRLPATRHWDSSPTKISASRTRYKHGISFKYFHSRLEGVLVVPNWEIY